MSTVILNATRDTRITRGHVNRNDGLHTRLVIDKYNTGHSKLKALVGFDITSLHGETIVSAEVQFRNVAKPNYGGNNASYGARRMLNDSWIEGNRKSDTLDCTGKSPGSGAGTTWECFVDDDIAETNSTHDCDTALRWKGAKIGDTIGDTFVAGITAGSEITPTDDGDWANQVIAFPVTSDVEEAVTDTDDEISWLFERTNSGKGKLHLGSREWANDCKNDLSYGPRLVVEIQ